MTITERNYFEVGWEVEVFGPNKCESFVVDKIMDGFGERNAARHPEEILYIPVPFKVEKYDLIRRKI